MTALRLLAGISVVATLLCLGLSAMASDDMSRSGEAGRLQLLMLAWLIVSIVTPFAAARIGTDGAVNRILAYLPMIGLGGLVRRNAPPAR